MVKVLINGCNGRMGKVLASQIEETENIEVIGGFDKEIRNASFPIFANIDDINIIPDVIIDFSLPEATFNILEFAKKHSIPTVIATTGFSDEQNKKIEELSKFFPIFKSANMSYEINLMAKLVAELATKLTESDIEIVETHHNKKIDSPSGTALLLADNINNALNGEMHYETNRASKKQKRDSKEIGISSVRGGTEVGKHSVIFFGNNESLEITHNVNSRAVFANGAIKAAFYIIDKQNGLFNMNNII